MSDDARSEGARALRRIFANAFSLFLAYTLPRLLTVGAVVVAARTLGAARFGEYGTAAAFAVLLSIVSTLGMSPLLVREMARDPAGSGGWLRGAHIVKTGSNILMLTLLFALGRGVLHYRGEVLLATLVLGCGYAVGAYAENLAAWVQSIERMEIWMQASALYGLVTGGLGALLVVLTRSVVWFCVATLLGQCVALLWLAARAPHGLRLGARPARIRPLLRALVPFALAFIALTAHSKLEVLLLGHWRASSDVGVYTAAHKFIDVIQALAVAGAAAVYPRLARANANSAVLAATRLMELTLLSGVVAAGTLWLARDTLVPLLFGSAYSAAIPVTALLAIAIAPLAVNIVGGYVLAAGGHIRAVAALYGAALLLKVALNGLLVPAHGAAGTAQAMLLTEAGLAAGMMAVLRVHAGVRPRAVILASALLSAASAGVLAWLREPGGSAVAALAFVATTGVVCAVAGALPHAERAVVLAALRGAGGEAG